MRKTMSDQLTRYSIRERMTHAWLGYVFAEDLRTAISVTGRDQEEAVHCKRSRFGVVVTEDVPTVKRENYSSGAADLPIWY
jgi:hypothetical protein